MRESPEPEVHFKEFIRLTGMTHVRTSPYYPQSNGKLERYHRTIKSRGIRAGRPATLDQARELIARFVEHYNNIRLHSAIGYIAPADFLAGRGPAIWADVIASSTLLARSVAVVVLHSTRRRLEPRVFLS